MTAELAAIVSVK